MMFKMTPCQITMKNHLKVYNQIGFVSEDIATFCPIFMYILNVLLQFVQPMNIPLKSYDLLNRMTGNGLGITYKFTRTISVFSPKMVSIELTLTNHGESSLSGIKVGKKVGKKSLLDSAVLYGNLTVSLIYIKE